MNAAALSGKTDIGDVNKDLKIEGYFWIARVGPCHKYKCPYKIGGWEGVN